MRWIFLALVAGSIGVAGLAAEATPAAAENDKQFHKQLLEIAKDYQKWGRLDDETHWAPQMCRAPLYREALPSRSKDTDTHGQKLYSLFAKDPRSYVKLFPKVSWNRYNYPKPTIPENGVGQVVVKESWIPREATAKEAEQAKKGLLRGSAPIAWKDEKAYLAEKQADLFVMFKLDPKTPGTDAGWVYGTVTPDGKTVTSAGMVESCIKCHRDAKQDRLFGPVESSEIRDPQAK